MHCWMFSSPCLSSTRFPVAIESVTDVCQMSPRGQNCSWFKFNSLGVLIINALFKNILFPNFSTFLSGRLSKPPPIPSLYLSYLIYTFGQAQNLSLTLLHLFLIFILMNACDRQDIELVPGTQRLIRYSLCSGV